MIGTSAVSGIWRRAPAHFVAVQAGHHDVEQHQIGRRARGNLQAPSRRSARGSACGRASSPRPGCRGWLWRRPPARRGNRKVFSLRRADFSTALAPVAPERQRRVILQHVARNCGQSAPGKVGASARLIVSRNSSRAGIELRQQLGQLGCDGARLARIHVRGAAGAGPRLIGSSASQRGPQLCEQRVKGGGNCCAMRLRLERFGCAIANGFLQSASGRLDGFGADIAGHAFERVRESFREGDIACWASAVDLSYGRALVARRTGAGASDIASDFLPPASAHLRCQPLIPAMRLAKPGGALCAGFCGWIRRIPGRGPSVGCGDGL